MNIGFDMMGGDFAPLEAVKGVQQFLQHQQTGAVTVFCIGQQKTVLPLLEEYNISNNVTFIEASDVIGYNEHPTKALREKPNSSIGIGFKLLATGKIDAFASAGNTGAMLVGTMFSLKPIEGILRPTIATVVPKINGSTGLLLDAGLNVDCKPEQLNQFAWMGSIYAKEILGFTNPKIGLVNVGEEDPSCHTIVVMASAEEINNKVVPSQSVVSGPNTGAGGTPEMSTAMVSVSAPQLLLTVRINRPD